MALSRRQTILTPAPKLSKHIRRNEGAISAILEAFRAKLLQAIETEGFHGRVICEVAVVEQDATMLDVVTRQAIKLK